MKQLIFLFFLLFTSQLSFSQGGSLKGIVIHADRKEVFPFVKIVLVETDFKTKTDLNGQFLIENIPEGNYILKAIHYEFDDEPLYVVEIFKDSTVEIKINGPKPCKYDGISKRCPSCKKRNKVIPIIYGLPSAKLYQNAKKGKVRLGGCVISGCDPKWYCKRDEIQF